MLSFAKEMQIERTEQDAKTVRVALFPFAAVLPGEFENVRKTFFGAFECCFKETGRVQLDRFKARAVREIAHDESARVGAESADDELFAGQVHSENAERIAMSRGHDGVDGALARGRFGQRNSHGLFWLDAPRSIGAR